MALADEKYMLLTTFRRDGRPVATPVWLARLPGDEIGFYSGSQSGKAKRIRHTAKVTMQACNAKGNQTHGPVIEGTARLVSGGERDQVWAAIRAKYGFIVSITQRVVPLVARLRGQPLQNAYGDIAVIITPASPA